MIDFCARWSHSRRLVVFLFPRVHYTGIARAVAHIRSPWFGPWSAFETSLTPICVVSVFFFNSNFISHVCFSNKGSATSPRRAAFFTTALLFQALDPLAGSMALHVSDVAVANCWKVLVILFFFLVHFPVIESSFTTKVFFMPGVYLLSCLCSATVKLVCYSRRCFVFLCSLNMVYRYSIPLDLCGHLHLLPFTI